MQNLRLIVAAGLGALMSFGAQSVSAQTAKLTGVIHGALAPTVCGTPAAGVSLSSFQETTPANAPSASGVFELSIVSTCVAPFYQALFSQEAIAATFDLGGGYALSLTNARLTHVDIENSSGGPGFGVRIKLGIASTQVALTTPGSAPATPPSVAPAKGSASTVSAGAAAAIKQSGTTVAAMPGSNAARAAAAAPRPRAPTIQLTPSAVNTNIPAAAGQSWAGGGARMSAHLIATSPALNTTTAGWPFGYSLQVHATVNGATGMPAAPFQISFSFSGETEGTPQPATDGYTRVSSALYAAALARVQLTQAVMTWSGTTQTGITLWLKSARFSGGQSFGGSNNARYETVSISASQLTITDVGSGRTASLQ